VIVVAVTAETKDRYVGEFRFAVVNKAPSVRIANRSEVLRIVRSPRSIFEVSEYQLRYPEAARWSSILAPLIFVTGIGVDSVNKYKIFSKYDALDIHRKMEPQLLIGIDDKAISDTFEPLREFKAEEDYVVLALNAFLGGYSLTTFNNDPDVGLIKLAFHTTAPDEQRTMGDLHVRVIAASCNVYPFSALAQIRAAIAGDQFWTNVALPYHINTIPVVPALPAVVPDAPDADPHPPSKARKTSHSSSPHGASKDGVK